MSVGIQQNNVHEIVTLTGRVNIEARNISQSVLVKTARVSYPHGRGRAHGNPTPVSLAAALRRHATRGKAAVLTYIWPTH